METKFEKGKWYKNLGFKQDYIGKFNGMLDNEWCCEEYIHEGTHYCDFGKLTNNFTYAVECTLEEIQQYLPDGHVDKFTPQKWDVGTFVVFCEDIWKYKKGDIDVITKAPLINYNNMSLKQDNCVSINREKQGTFNWFATRKEAEEFAETLKPKQPKFKVGDYLSDLDNTYHIVKITKIEDNKYNGWGFSGIGSWCDNTSWRLTSSKRERLATPKEIEEFLIKVAKVKYPKGTKFISSKNANNTCTVTKENYGFYNVIEDKFQLNVDSKGNYFTNCIYYKGEWATILVEEKSFTLESSWYIQLTKQNFDVVSKWHKSIDRINGRVYNIGSYYGVYSNGTADAWSKGNLPQGKQVITFEQFKQYVLKQKETMEKPFEDPREVTFEMITTHPYFKTLDEKELQSIIGVMDLNGWRELPGSNSTEKTKLLMLKFNNNMTKQDFTIEGSVALKEAFVKESGLIDHYGTPWKETNLFMTSRDGCKGFNSMIMKKPTHFILPQQWNEALAYVKEYFKEEEFKVGDWVYVISADKGAKGADDLIGQITNKNMTNGVDSSMRIYSCQNEEVWGIGVNYKLRKATPEEIKAAKYKEFPLGGYTAKVTKDVVLVEGKGKVTAREWLKLSEKLAGATAYCDGFVVSFDTISIGCIHNITVEQFNSVTYFLRDNESNS